MDGASAVPPEFRFPIMTEEVLASGMAEEAETGVVRDGFGAVGWSAPSFER